MFCILQRNEITIPLDVCCTKHYKKNVIIGDLHRVKNLSSDFEQEVRIIRNKYIKAGYPFRFVNSVIDGFNQEKEDLLILTSSCSKFYVGETKRNTEVRWGEHCFTKKMSEVGDHLLLNPGHTVNWKILIKCS